MMVCKLWSSAALSVIYNREGCQNELKKKQEHEKCKGSSIFFIQQGLIADYSNY